MYEIFLVGTTRTTKKKKNQIYVTIQYTYYTRTPASIPYSFQIGNNRFTYYPPPLLYLRFQTIAAKYSNISLRK